MPYQVRRVADSKVRQARAAPTGSGVGPVIGGRPGSVSARGASRASESPEMGPDPPCRGPWPGGEAVDSSGRGWRIPGFSPAGCRPLCGRQGPLEHAGVSGRLPAEALVREELRRDSRRRSGPSRMWGVGSLARPGPRTFHVSEVGLGVGGETVEKFASAPVDVVAAGAEGSRIGPGCGLLVLLGYSAPVQGPAIHIYSR